MLNVPKIISFYFSYLVWFTDHVVYQTVIHYIYIVIEWFLCILVCFHVWYYLIKHIFLFHDCQYTYIVLCKIATSPVFWLLELISNLITCKLFLRMYFYSSIVCRDPNVRVCLLVSMYSYSVLKHPLKQLLAKSKVTRF